ncbi:putative glycosyltransferase EpsF [compost metagenome]
MRILFVSEFYYPRIGGAEKVVQMVAEHCAQQGWECHVATTGTTSSTEVINGVQVHRLPISGNLVKGIKGDGTAFTRLIDSIKPHVLFIYALQTWGSDLTLINRSQLDPEIKVVLVPCGLSALSSFARRILYSAYLRRLKASLQAFDHYIFHTTIGNDFRFYSGLPRSSYSIIPNAASSELFQLNRESAESRLRDAGLAQLTTSNFVLNVSNHYSIKGHQDLIASFTKCFPKGFRLVIAGTQPSSGRSCYNECKSKSDEHENILLVDGSERSLVLALYRTAKLFFLSSSIEYVPLVLLEAQASRLPFISFPVGNAREMEGGVVLSKQEITPPFIQTFLNDDQRLNQLGEQGYLQVQRSFKQEIVLQQYQTLFEKISPS